MQSKRFGSAEKKLRVMFRFCCCCCSHSKDENDPRSRAVTEEDYLLPGGEWDGRSSRGSSVWSSRTSTRSTTGNYEPPPVPPTKTLPSFDDFRLLRTVGRGAFGKVRVVFHCFLCTTLEANKLYVVLEQTVFCFFFTCKRFLFLWLCVVSRCCWRCTLPHEYCMP